MSRAASATHYSPDVIGRLRGHDLRTDRAAYLVRRAGVRYRESCPSDSPFGERVRRTLNRVRSSV